MADEFGEYRVECLRVDGGVDVFGPVRTRKEIEDIACEKHATGLYAAPYRVMFDFRDYDDSGDQTSLAAKLLDLARDDTGPA